MGFSLSYVFTMTGAYAEPFELDSTASWAATCPALHARARSDACGSVDLEWKAPAGARTVTVCTKPASGPAIRLGAKPGLVTVDGHRRHDVTVTAQAEGARNASIPVWVRVDELDPFTSGLDLQRVLAMALRADPERIVLPPCSSPDLPAHGPAAGPVVFYETLLVQRQERTDRPLLSLDPAGVGRPLVAQERAYFKGAFTSCGGALYGFMELMGQGWLVRVDAASVTRALFLGVAPRDGSAGCMPDGSYAFFHNGLLKGPVRSIDGPASEVVIWSGGPTVRRIRWARPTHYFVGLDALTIRSDGQMAVLMGVGEESSSIVLLAPDGTAVGAISRTEMYTDLRWVGEDLWVLRRDFMDIVAPDGSVSVHPWPARQLPLQGTEAFRGGDPRGIVATGDALLSVQAGRADRWEWPDSHPVGGALWLPDGTMFGRGHARDAASGRFALWAGPVGEGLEPPPWAFTSPVGVGFTGAAQIDGRPVFAIYVDGEGEMGGTPLQRGSYLWFP